MTSSRDEKDLNLATELPNQPGMGRRLVFIVLGLGVLGICLGVVGSVFYNGWLSSAAGIIAVIACLLVAYPTLISVMSKIDEDSLENRIAHSTRQTSDDVVPVPEGSVIDEITDLPDARYYEVAVEGRLLRHVVIYGQSVLCFFRLVTTLKTTHPETSNRSLVSFTNLMRQTLHEADIACRIDATTFGLILEDASEEGGVWTAERLQIALSHDSTNILRLVAGVAAYHAGLFAKDIMVRAQAALDRASSTPAGHGLGQVEVAHVDLS